MEFAKIFNTKDMGQLCVIATAEHESGVPGITVYCRPPGLGVCTNIVLFTDTVEGEAKRELAFQDMTESVARGLARFVFEAAKTRVRPAATFDHTKPGLSLVRDKEHTEPDPDLLKSACTVCRWPTADPGLCSVCQAKRDLVPGAHTE